MAIIAPNLLEPGLINLGTFSRELKHTSIEMASGFLTIIQTSLLQQAKLSHSNGNSKLGGVGEKPGGKMVSKECVDVVAPNQFAALLRELIEVAQELAQMDSLLMDTRKHVPEIEEAQKWHDVSLRALIWSRQALAERQLVILARMKRGAETTSPMPTTRCCKENARMPSIAPVTLSQNKLSAGSLRSDLEKMKAYDRDQCLCVRNITKLGLSSHEKLRAYFERYGEVLEVLVAHCFEKPSAKRRLGRVRPATKGFVVMKESLAAVAVLQAGETHRMADGDQFREVLVQCFNPRAMEGFDEES